jgi:hypothetical protein
MMFEIVRIGRAFSRSMFDYYILDELELQASVISVLIKEKRGKH